VTRSKFFTSRKECDKAQSIPHRQYIYRVRTCHENWLGCPGGIHGYYPHAVNSKLLLSVHGRSSQGSGTILSPASLFPTSISLL